MAPLTASLALLAFTAQAFAAPTIVVDHVDNVKSLDDIGDYRGVVGCNGLMRKAICCGGTVFGVVHTGCVAPFPTPSNYTAFIQSCDEVVKTAQCCTLNVVRNFQPSN